MINVRVYILCIRKYIYVYIYTHTDKSYKRTHVYIYMCIPTHACTRTYISINPFSLRRVNI